MNIQEEVETLVEEYNVEDMSLKETAREIVEKVRKADPVCKALYEVLREINSYCEGYFSRLKGCHFWKLNKDINQSLAKYERRK